MLLEPAEFAECYVRLWNESNVESRRLGVLSMYAPDAIYAAHPWGPVSGHPAILERLATVHNRYGSSGYVFRSAHYAIGHHNSIKLNWVMVSTRTGEMEMAGQNVLVLDEDGRIKVDYRFHDRPPPSSGHDDRSEDDDAVDRRARSVRIRPVRIRP